METLKLSVEEEQKVVGVFSILKKIEDLRVSHEVISSNKDKLASVINHLIIPLSRSIVNTNKSKNNINEQLEDPVTDDLFATDPTFIEVKHYMEHSDTRFLLQAHIIQLLLKFIEDSLTTFNDLTPTSTSRKISNIDDGTPMMDEAERERFKRTAHTLILNYKNEAALSKKKVVASRILHLADSTEKYNIANDLFFDIVGEKALEKIKFKKKTNEVSENKPAGRNQEAGE